MKFWSHKSLAINYASTFVFATIISLLIINCAGRPIYPKYHLAQQVRVDGCIGVVVYAELHNARVWK